MSKRENGRMIAAEYKVVRSTENVEFPDHDLCVSCKGQICKREGSSYPCTAFPAASKSNSNILAGKMRPTEYFLSFHTRIFNSPSVPSYT